MKNKLKAKKMRKVNTINYILCTFYIYKLNILHRTHTLIYKHTHTHTHTTIYRNRLNIFFFKISDNGIIYTLYNKNTSPTNYF